MQKKRTQLGSAVNIILVDSRRRACTGWMPVQCSPVGNRCRTFTSWELVSHSAVENRCHAFTGWRPVLLTHRLEIGATTLPVRIRCHALTG